MNEHFKKGFTKIASPMLTDQTDNSAYTSNPHQEERQRILEEAYHNKDKSIGPNKVVKEESTKRQKTTINKDRE